MKGWIIFQESEAHYFTLRRRFDARQITEQQLSAAVQQYRIQDAQGVWWQMRPQDGAWLRWTGVSWQVASPSHLYGPQTLADFVLSIFKSLFKGLLWKLPLSAGAALAVWTLHTALIVVIDGGLASGTNALLNMILTLPESLASGLLFWSALSFLLALSLARVFKQGLNPLIQNAITTPAWIEYALAGSQGNILIALFSGWVLALFLDVIIGNRLVSFILMVMSLGALISQEDSFLLRLLRLAWSDALRLLNRSPMPFHPAWGALVIIGAVFGFMSAVVLPLMPYTGCVGAFLLSGVVLLLVLLKQGNRLGSAFLLGLSIPLAYLAIPAQAAQTDTFEFWRAIAYGILPAFGAFCGAHLGLTLGIWDGFVQPLPTSAQPVSRLVQLRPEPLPIQRPASPPPWRPANEPIVLKGQSALDVLVRLGMVKRVITPQGGRYLPVDLDPQGPISAIAYFLDEQGYLKTTLAIAYQPPAYVFQTGELDAQLPEEQSFGESDEAVSRLNQMLDALPVKNDFKVHLKERLGEMLEADHKAGSGLEYIRFQELGQAEVKPKRIRQWADALLFTAKNLLEYALQIDEPGARRKVLACAKKMAQDTRRIFKPDLDSEKNRESSALLEAIQAELDKIASGDVEPGL